MPPQQQQSHQQHTGWTGHFANKSDREVFGGTLEECSFQEEVVGEQVAKLPLRAVRPLLLEERIERRRNEGRQGQDPEECHVPSHTRHLQLLLSGSEEVT